MIREFFAQFNKTLAKRVVSSRYSYQVPIKLTFEQENKTGRLKMPKIPLYINGETKDLSQSGIGFMVSSIRLQENYLVGEDRVLNAELDLPNGKISMKVVGRRYEQLGEPTSSGKFLIGAKILEMSDEHKEFYEHFLINGGKLTQGKVLKFGVDQS
ncbi:MAG: PilZ domain-containing protein [Acidobacteriota bacterium]